MLPPCRLSCSLLQNKYILKIQYNYKDFSNCFWKVLTQSFDASNSFHFSSYYVSPSVTNCLMSAGVSLVMKQEIFQFCKSSFQNISQFSVNYEEFVSSAQSGIRTMTLLVFLMKSIIVFYISHQMISEIKETNFMTYLHTGMNIIWFL